jgi:hypothetical protein
VKKIYYSVIILVMVLCCILELRAESTLPKPKQQCYHYNCWTYEYSGTTMCDWEIEDCDGRAGEFPIIN